jgi:hypothetical protein
MQHFSSRSGKYTIIFNHYYETTNLEFSFLAGFPPSNGIQQNDATKLTPMALRPRGHYLSPTMQFGLAMKLKLPAR